MKIMCPPCYHHNGFVATHALGHLMYGFIRTSCIHTVSSVHQPYIMCPSA